MVEQVEELATINTQFDKDLTFEDHDNIPIDYSIDTTKVVATAGGELETSVVEV